MRLYWAEFQGGPVDAVETIAWLAGIWTMRRRRRAMTTRAGRPVFVIVRAARSPKAPQRRRPGQQPAVQPSAAPAMTAGKSVGRPASRPQAENRAVRQLRTSQPWAVACMNAPRVARCCRAAAAGRRRGEGRGSGRPRTRGRLSLLVVAGPPRLAGAPRARPRSSRGRRPRVRQERIRVTDEDDRQLVGVVCRGRGRNVVGHTAWIAGRYRSSSSGALDGEPLKAPTSAGRLEPGGRRPG
jgi:hypothetical protein